MRGRPLAALLSAALLIAGIVPAGSAAAGLNVNPFAGFRASVVVTRPDGTPRDDASIAVGDDLSVAFAAVDGTAATACYIRIVAIGGELMDAPGEIVDGACRMAVRLPDFPDPTGRALFQPDDIALDLCVWPLTITFADAEPRGMRAEDRLAPAGRSCNTGGSGADFTSKVDIRVAPGGSPRPFTSEPQILSWNPADWDTGMQPLEFGATWHLQYPDWMTSCWPMLRGSWLTSIRAERSPTCEPWDVRVPGILPATLPWTGDLGDWNYYIDTFYASGLSGPDSLTISAARMPLATSDGVFASNRRAVFPVDLATTRFVTAGEAWHPVFQVDGAGVESCTLEIYTQPPIPGDPLITDRYPATPDADGRCSFDLPAMAEDEYHQYYVTLAATGVTPSDIVFGGSIMGIPPPAPPAIDPPTEEAGGDTGIGVDAGAGNGLVVDLSVEASTAALAATPTLRSGSPAVATSTTSEPACHDRAVSGNLASGGSIPHLDARCGLLPGTYRATATMIDAAGKTSTSSRLFTVLPPRPTILSRTPASGATGIPRDVRPSVTFDLAVKGVSTSTIRLRDVSAGVWVSASMSYDATHHRATLRPAAILGAGRTYRLYVTSGISSLAGRAISATNWSFRVSTDERRPTFTHSPGTGATGVSRTANVRLQFSERVRGVSGSTLRLKNTVTGAWVPAVVTYDAVLRRATLNPSVTLRGLRRYVVVVGTGIKDSAGNPLAATSWTFTTRS
jgi:hypothetical protein